MLRYKITEKLLKTISNIHVQVQKFELKKYNSVVLAEFDFTARSLSAFASTSIEGNPLPLTQVRQILKNSPKEKRQTEIEVLNYNATLVWLNQRLNSKGTTQKKTQRKIEKIKFDEKFALQLHQSVMQNLLIQSKCGRYRNEPVFVNDPRLHKTIYWPPNHSDVKKLMTDLLEFIHENINKIDPIILAGLFHKQFVIVHPFIDGNGRSIRLLTKALLAILGIDTFHLFSFENFYNQNVSQYFQHVGVRGNYYDIAAKIDFTTWLEYFADGLLDELFRVEKELDQIQQREFSQPQILPDQSKIIDFLKENGRITDLQYSKFTSRAKATRALDFRRLCQLDIIERMGVGRATFYVLKK
jgi:Fic family protein